MLTIIVTIAIAFAVCVVVMITSRVADVDQLGERRRTPLMMGVQIICADCAGEGYQPSRTFLDRNGCCAQCGGSSFLLASIVAAHRAQIRAEQLAKLHTGPSRGRVLPFGVPSARATRRHKLAV